ncbi:ScbR family autoregulator-binding transcription factor [Streptomyces sp. NPDC097619]|uniref:ScbR family autoregulator-binding transcription factor n=1 Tax=Streptomyces sp. NPDC097619 TaxID=3157228 RepID=UPI0033197531
MTKQERAARTRHSLIRSAAEVFDEDGFVSSSLAMISARAGVSNGALHFHFVSKHALAEAVAESALAALDQITGTGSVTGPRTSLRGMAEATELLARRLREDVVLRAGFVLSADLGWKGGTDLRRSWTEFAGRALARAAETGEVAADVDLDDALTVIAGSVVGFEAMGRSDARWLEPDTFDRLWRLLLPRLGQAQPVGSCSC